MVHGLPYVNKLNQTSKAHRRNNKKATYTAAKICKRPDVITCEGQGTFNGTVADREL